MQPPRDSLATRFLYRSRVCHFQTELRAEQFPAGGLYPLRHHALGHPSKPFCSSLQAFENRHIRNSSTSPPSCSNRSVSERQALNHVNQKSTQQRIYVRKRAKKVPDTPTPHLF